MLRNTLDLLVKLWIWAIIIRALMSWFRPRTYNRTYYDVSRFLHRITEPILEPIRRYLPMGGGIDLSPLIAILLLQILWSFLAPFVP
ncbi:MAG: YggT family protein [Bacillota bacterium]